jgi:hypothetical protein
MSNQLPTNGITIDQAKEWTNAWQSKNPTISKAFLIPTTDIISLFKELQVLVLDSHGNFIINDNNSMDVALRAYLAIGPSEEKEETGLDEEKLVLVGAVAVNEEYQDQVEETENKLQVTLSGSGAFDFTKPCPKFCDPKSPLNHG